MVSFNYKKTFLCLVLSLAGLTQTGPSKFLNDVDFQQLEDQIERNGADCSKICIEKLIARCIKARGIKVDCMDTGAATANSICAQMINADNICAKKLNVSEQFCCPMVSAPMVSGQTVCADQLNANNVCVRGTLITSNFQPCGLYSATVAYSSGLTPYTLSTPLNFDVIVADPNGDVTFFPTTYTAPLSGDYLLSIQLDQQDLIGSAPILGIPIGQLNVTVNAILSRQSYFPYLSFHNEQRATYSSAIHLNAGDQLTASFDVLVMTDANGFQPYVGTINIIGSGSEINSSLLKVNYLSSDCTDFPACQPCTITPCVPVACNLPCASCTDCCDMTSCCS